MKYKIVVGPTHMYVKRYGIQSELVEIGNEYISSDSEKAIKLYTESIHPICKDLMSFRWKLSRLHWRKINQQAEKVVKQFETLYFDGPEHIVSTVPWKQAKYGEWFFVEKKFRSALKKFAKN